MSGQDMPYGPGPADGRGASSPFGGPTDYSVQSSAAAGPVASGPAPAAEGYGPPPPGAIGYGPPSGYGPSPGYGPPPGYGQPGYGPPGYGPPGYGPPGYGPPSGYGAAPGYQAAPGYGAAPGAQGSVDVVGLRVGQYLLDAVVAVVPMIVLLVVGGVLMGVSGGSGGPAVVGAIVYFVGYLAALVSGFAVYAWWPSTHGGQTPAMGWLGLRVIRQEDGGEPSLGRHALRWILLIVDGAFVGIVGLIIMSASQHKQRLGDMAAHTLVVRT